MILTGSPDLVSSLSFMASGLSLCLLLLSLNHYLISLRLSTLYRLIFACQVFLRILFRFYSFFRIILNPRRRAPAMRLLRVPRSPLISRFPRHPAVSHCRTTPQYLPARYNAPASLHPAVPCPAPAVLHARTQHIFQVSPFRLLP